jgi:hypothetical protein
MYYSLAEKLETRSNPCASSDTSIHLSFLSCCSKGRRGQWDIYIYIYILNIKVYIYILDIKVNPAVHVGRRGQREGGEEKNDSLTL